MFWFVSFRFVFFCFVFLFCFVFFCFVLFLYVLFCSVFFCLFYCVFLWFNNVIWFCVITLLELGLDWGFCYFLSSMSMSMPRGYFRLSRNRDWMWGYYHIAPPPTPMRKALWNILLKIVPKVIFEDICLKSLNNTLYNLFNCSNMIT